MSDPQAWSAVFFAFLVAFGASRGLRKPPLALRAEKDDYQTGDDFKDVPMDDPMRSPDYCHSHHQTYPCDGEEK